MDDLSVVIKKPLLVKRKEGDSWTIKLLVTVLIDITGASALFQIRDVDNNVILEKETPTDITIVGQLITVFGYPADLVGKAGTYSWEIEVFDADDHNYTLMGGPFICTPQVSKPVV